MSATHATSQKTGKQAPAPADKRPVADPMAVQLNPLWQQMAMGGGWRSGALAASGAADGADDSAGFGLAMRGGLAPVYLQRACAPCEEQGEADRASANRDSEPAADDSGLVQRKCPACEQDDEIQRAAAMASDGVQVGPAHDAYEAEADYIADLVMSVPASVLPFQAAPVAPLQTAPAGRPALVLQRQDDDVVEEVTGGPEEGEEDPLAATGEGEEPVADDESEPEIQCKRGSEPAARREGIGPELRASRGFGAALPAATREFMEQRFGLDFGAVRVHTDARAARMNDAVGALAFTSGQDIYFAAGRYRPGSPDGDRLLAHELTHVVQQSGGAAPAPMGIIQRATTYENKWYYGRYIDRTFPSGRVVHHHVEQRLRQANRNLITEAPIPGATALNRAPNVIGSADLYAAPDNRVPDLRADFRADRGGALTFWPLTPGRRGKAQSQAAIDWSPGARRPGRGQTADIVPRNDFPSSFSVADLKPLSVRRGGGGIAQVANYQEGMAEFAARVHTASGGATRITPRGGMLATLDIPPALDYEHHFDPDRPDQPSGGLTYGNRRIWLASRLTRGLVLYFDIATAAPSAADLRRYNDLLRRMHDLTGDLRRPGSPIPNTPGFGTKMRPGVSRLAGVAAARGTARVQRTNWRERGRQWEGRRSTWGREARTFLRGGGRGIARRQGVDRALGISRPNPRGRPGDQVGEFRRLRFWSGRIGQFVGRIRFLMGETFDRIAERFEGFRRRFRQWHQRARSMAGSSPGGGWRRTLIRLLLRAMQVAVSRLMAESFRIFADCTNGIIRKAIRMVTDDASDIVRERVCNLQRAFAEFKDRIQEEFEDKFGPIEQFVDAGRTVARVGEIVLTMISLLRLGFQVVSCLAPPALGCLWGLVGQLALEVVLELLIGTQWFEDNIIRHASIREWLLRAVGPQYQRLIHATLERVGLQDFAADVSECQLQVPELGSLLGGERSLEGGALTAHRAEFEGRHRAEMMASLRAHFSGADGRPASEQELRALLEEMGRRGMTPEQIREAVEGGRTEPGGRIAVGAVRDRLTGGGGIAGAAEPGAETTEEPQEAPAPRGAGDRVDTPGGAPVPARGEGEREAEREGAGGVPVASAADRRYDGTGGAPLEGARARVREGRGGHTVGTEPVIDIVGYWQGTPVEIIVDVPTRVVRRTFFPSGSTAETATHLVVHYELLIGIRFTRIPGGGTLERGRIVRYALPWSGAARR